MEGQFNEIIKYLEEEIKKENSYSYLPEIIELLKIMQSTLKTKAKNAEYRKNMLRGLGRLVTESIVFSESDLGTKILELADKYSNFK